MTHTNNVSIVCGSVFKDNIVFTYIMGEYETYSNIQTHIQISENLYDIDLRGKYILSEIGTKKNTKVGRRGLLLLKEYETIYNSINDTINLCRFKSRLYLTLQYYLDEALFNNISEDQEYFYIEDDSYNLTKLYFDQQQWVRHNGIQKFSLVDDDKSLNVDEALLLLNSFFKKYEALLENVSALVRDVSDDKRYKRKIMQVIARIKSKHAPSIEAIKFAITNEVPESSQKLNCI